MTDQSKPNKHRHRGPYDRGSADAYYGRSYSPHYYVDESFHAAKITRDQMTPEQIAEYREGYEQEGSSKDWGNAN
jgi:hypothetical protein